MIVSVALVISYAKRMRRIICGLSGCTSFSSHYHINGTNVETRKYLTLNLLTTTIVAPPSNASKWQMGFNSAFKGLNSSYPEDDAQLLLTTM